MAMYRYTRFAASLGHWSSQELQTLRGAERAERTLDGGEGSGRNGDYPLVN